MDDNWKIEDGYMVKVIKTGNATVTIRRPLLTEEEYAHRVKIVEEALEQFGRACIREGVTI